MLDQFFFKNYIKLKAIFLELTVRSKFAHRSFRVRPFTHRSGGKVERLWDSISTTSRVLLRENVPKKECEKSKYFIKYLIEIEKKKL